MKSHPSEADLALFAGGEASGLSRFFVNRHVRECRECMDQVTRFELLRLELREFEPPAHDWNRLAAEMRANIHVGLEAGECVRQATTAGRSGWSPKLAVAFACLLLLVGASFLMKGPAPNMAQDSAAAVLESTGSGLELRHGVSSMTLLNHDGVAADQTVSAQGEIRARYVDGGAVTINNVYLE